MSPRHAFLLLLLGCGGLGSGCASTSLWNWGAGRTGQGELLGVVRGDGAPRVLYELEPPEGDEQRHCVFAIPRSWTQRPMATYMHESGEEMLGLEPPLRCVDIDPVPEPNEEIQPLEVAATIGRVVPNVLDRRNVTLVDTGARVAAGERYGQFGLVQLVGTDQTLIHEIYGYDSHRYRWIRLGAVRLGAWERSGGRIAAAVLLTPLAVVADAFLVLGAASMFVGGAYIPFGPGREDPADKTAPVPELSRGFVAKVPPRRPAEVAPKPAEATPEEEGGEPEPPADEPAPPPIIDV